ncbi:MAG: putative dehydrogenase [Naasia sp.]|jgi:predicted dehydrogenase|uniref:Gfo/Idh/MocA family protein n=1 Tax=Naasia sp. TaxID=2546198 RepID=UPI00261479E8|nr:Gfo/Idh/MocA family oxidoreductase [Naasia sp.]MCU1570723.1 putative dehydrogenase [Naasia sp.]
MTLRVGILGAADIAPKALIDPVRRRDGDVEIVAVASRRADAAAAYAEAHDIPRSHVGYEALLADPDVDLVYNALPPSAHAEWSIAALEAGKDVLCEKPFAMDAEQAAEMVAAADRTGRRLIEAFHDRYHPLWGDVAAYRTSGRIGEIVSVRGTFEVDIPFGPEAIRSVPALGGGALMDLGCYPLHWLRAFTGEEPEVTEAEARLNSLGADQSIRASVSFPSGVTGSLSASMAGPLVQRLVLEGTRGRLTVDGMVFPSRGHSIQEEIDGVTRFRTVAGAETYDHQLSAVVAGLASGERLPTEGQDSIANMRAIDAIYASAGVERPRP